MFLLLGAPEKETFHSEVEISRYHDGTRSAKEEMLKMSHKATLTIFVANRNASRENNSLELINSAL